LLYYIKAIDIGLRLHEAYGFKVVRDIDLDATTENPFKEFTRLREKLQCPIHGRFICRPKQEIAEQQIFYIK
jgi:hypothetical protein